MEEERKRYIFATNGVTDFHNEGVELIALDLIRLHLLMLAVASYRSERRETKRKQKKEG